MTNFINKIRNWCSNWWANNGQEVKNLGTSLKDNGKRFIEIFDRVSKNVARLITIGIIVTIAVNCFYPDFAEQFPALYGWFNGWVQLAAFCLTVVFKFFAALFTGTIPEYLAEYNECFYSLLEECGNWFKTLSF